MKLADRDHELYCIYDMVNNVPYYGVSNEAQHRFNCHLLRLRAGTHANRHLQLAHDKEGDPFELRILATGMTKVAAEALEKQLIETNPHCYNIKDNPARAR